MAFLTAGRRPPLEAVSRLAYANPFLPERVASERGVPGAEFQEGAPVWSQRVADPEARRVNELPIEARLEPLAEPLRSRLAAGEVAREPDLALYQDAVL